MQEVRIAHRALPDLCEMATVKLQSGAAKRTKLAVTWSATVRLLTRNMVGISSDCFPSFRLQSDPCTHGWNLLQGPFTERPPCQQVFFWEGSLVWYFKINADIALFRDFSSSQALAVGSGAIW